MRKHILIGMLVLCMAAARASATTIGYWRFEEGTVGANPSGGTANAIIDSSGSGNNGTANNTSLMTYSSSVLGSPITGPVSDTKSMSFTAGATDNGYVNVPDAASLQLTTAFTIEAFIKPTVNASSSLFDGIAYKWNSTTLLGSYAFRMDTGNFLRLVLNDATAAVALDSTTVIPLNQWTRVAATWSTSDHTMRLYINGVQEATTASFTGPIYEATSNPLLIGTTSATAANSFQGLIDEVRISNTVLSPSQFLNVVPEPSSWALGAIGLIALMAWRRWR